MLKAKRLSVFAALVYTLATPLSVAAGEGGEPNAVELVRAVRGSENWIHNAESFFLSVESTWTTTPEGIAARRGELKRRYSDSELDPNRFWDLRPRRKDFLEFGVERDRLYFLAEEPGRSRSLRIWDGKEAFWREQYFVSKRDRCYLGPGPEKVFECLFANLSWLRSQPHSFWFDPRDVDERLKYYGNPEDFAISGRQEYRGVDCHVLDWKPKKGLFAASDLSKRWYVGVKDRRLYGLATFLGNRVDVEHFTLCYRKIAPGCWFPMVQGYDIYDHDKSGNHYLKSRRYLRVLTVRVNARLPEELFKIELKDGVEMIDERSGRRIDYVYKAPLLGKALPSLAGLMSNSVLRRRPGSATLLCFLDVEQRASRNCLRELAGRARTLRENSVTVLPIQASNIIQGKLDEWVKENGIPLPVASIEGDERQIRFTWGVKSLPWLILTDHKRVVTAEGFGLDQLDKTIRELATSSAKERR
ncbi:MAG: hypothetical protein ACYSWQ_16960 [Planctomycetota bacterium]|jgi:hypothetical protein